MSAVSSSPSSPQGSSANSVTPLRDDVRATAQAARVVARRHSKSTGWWVGRVLLYAVLIVASVAMLIPFFWMIMSSFKRDNEVFSVPVRWLPATWHPENYLRIFSDSMVVTR